MQQSDFATTHDEVPLIGGRANLGSVVRIGDQVARPAHPQSRFVENFLRHLRAGGCDFVPEPRGLDRQGRQRLTYIEGQAPTSPYPSWAWDQDLLVDLAQRQREMHRAAVGFRPDPAAVWAVSGGDYFPPGAAGDHFCHNDLCMSNIIVAADRQTVAGIVDFDYVAPTSRLFDVAVLARHWTPFGDPDGRDLADLDRAARVARFRTICEVHELAEAARSQVLDLATEFLVQARSNVRALADAGNEGFRRMIADGYEATNAATVDWIATNRQALVTR